MQDIQPNVEKEKWLSVWGFKLTSSEEQLFGSLSALATLSFSGIQTFIGDFPFTKHLFLKN
jgi:hypothetical protein